MLEYLWELNNDVFVDEILHEFIENEEFHNFLKIHNCEDYDIFSQKHIQDFLICIMELIIYESGLLYIDFDPNNFNNLRSPLFPCVLSSETSNIIWGEIHLEGVQ